MIISIKFAFIYLENMLIGKESLSQQIGSREGYLEPVIGVEVVKSKYSGK
jgi:hypothetical protein